MVLPVQTVHSSNTSIRSAGRTLAGSLIDARPMPHHLQDRPYAALRIVLVRDGQTETAIRPSLGFSLSAGELVERYRAKQLSPVEVTRAALDRIAKLQPTYNAFVTVGEREALQAARESKARWLRGEPAGLVDGLPTTVKDLLLAKGWPTYRGSRTTSPTAARLATPRSTPRLRLLSTKPWPRSNSLAPRSKRSISPWRTRST